MKKNLLKMVSAALAAAMLLSACSTGGAGNGASKSSASAGTTGKAEYELTLAHSAEANHPWQTVSKQFAQTVEKKTNGRVKFKAIYTAGEMGGEAEMAQSLQNGTLDMIIIATMGMSSLVPDVQIYDYPYLFPDANTAYKILDGKVGQQVSDKMEQKGFHVLAYLENDYRGFSNNKHPINTPADLKGLKLRVPASPVLTAWMQKCGASPTTMAFNEVYSALQTGVVDGQDNGIILTYTHKLGEVQKYYTMSNHIYCPAPLMVNENVWKSMPDDIKKVIEDAAVEARDEDRKLNQQARVKDEEELKKQGVQVTELSKENLQKFVDSARSVYPQFTKLVDKDVYDAMMDAIKQ